MGTSTGTLEQREQNEGTNPKIVAAVSSIILAIIALLFFVGEPNGWAWIWDTAPYPARWHCGQWSAKIGWLYILSDISIWLGYLGIPLLLIYFTWNLPDLPFQPLLLLFSTFILSCGTTHLMDAIIFWWPAYGVAAVLKLVTAIASIATLIALFRVIPDALKLRSPRELQLEVDQRTRELQLANQLAQTLIQSSPLGMLEVDSRGVILLANSSVTEIFGYSKSELVGKPIEILLPQELHQRHRKIFAEYVKTPERRTMAANRDLYGVNKNGQAIPVAIDLTPVIREQELTILCTILNVQEIQQREEKLKLLNNALRSSNRDLEQFAYAASHDLQEPLRKIKSYTELFLHDHKDKLQPEGRQQLDVVIDASGRMKEMVTDLLAFARLSSQGMAKQPVDCNQCVQTALSQLEMAIKDNQAEISVGELPTVMAKESQLSLLFQNLISNAIKYQKAGAKPEISITCVSESEFWKFTVSDNGVGFASEHAERIFEIFQRLHQRTKYSGTGIGLSLCRKIVEMFGGRIYAESEPGVGSNFVFTLPKMPTYGPLIASVADHPTQGAEQLNQDSGRNYYWQNDSGKNQAETN